VRWAREEKARRKSPGNSVERIDTLWRPSIWAAQELIGESFEESDSSESATPQEQFRTRSVSGTVTETPALKTCPCSTPPIQLPGPIRIPSSRNAR
jgi:hypothetical protein